MHACIQAGVPSGHLLEGKAQHGDLLARDGVEHGVDHALHKALLLVVVDLDHLRAPLQSIERNPPVN